MVYFKFKEKCNNNKTCNPNYQTLLERCSIWLLSLLIPKANPDFDDKIFQVSEWYLEFDDEDEPWREIGLDINGQVIVKMPDEHNCGFWLDTCMKLEDFKREFQLQPISERDFNDLWNSVYFDRKEGKIKKCEGYDGTQGACGQDQ